MSEEKKGEDDALFRLIQARYGDRLSSSELEEVRKGIGTIIDASRSLRSVKLAYWDEPDFTFKPRSVED